MGSSKYIQFLDSDTVLDSEWLGKAITAIQSSKAGAVAGDRREMRPEASVFNWIGDLEWNGEPGEAECFGGDVLASREALERTGGYDPDLSAGSGCIVMRITSHATDNYPAIGSYYAIHWESFTGSGMREASAYKTGGDHNLGMNSRDAADAEYTVANGYYGMHGEYLREE